MANLITWWRDFVDLVFPRCCEACSRGLVGNEATICTRCRIALPRIEKNSLYAELIRYQFVHIPAVSSTQSFLLFTKRGKVQKLLHAMKYKGNQEVGLVLGRMFGQELVAENRLPEAALIISVPLHQRKLKQRGYNQSDLLAEGLSQATGIPWSGSVLTRKKYTETQTGKSKKERHDNVQGVFEAQRQDGYESVIILDDVLTTGATLCACIEALKDAGYKQFHVLTIAMAEH